MMFPFDKIKVDRCFIKGLPDDDSSIAIVQAVVSLANSLGMTTIAEGVETKQQFEILKGLGCTEVQGYLLGPPSPAHETSQRFVWLPSKAASAA